MPLQEANLTPSFGGFGISDPLYGCQWHLNNDDQFPNSAGQDIRVEEVWPTYTGSGINVAVVDDGMYYQHQDLTDNVLTSFNHNYHPGQTDIHDPSGYRNHGTAVAGLIAAKGNSLGMRGVAPDAKIYGYNYLVEQTDANKADAMSLNAATTAISNNSWGPDDFGHPEPAAAIWESAVKDGVTTGYDGKGVFYAWAAGNGGGLDYSTLDELANFYAVTAVCAVGHDDIRSDNSEAGANLWVCGPSSSGRGGQPRIATTDNGHRYRDSFGGTSAATPIVSGVAALIRGANNALTWRDVKLILAASARKVDPDNTGWEQGAFEYGSTTNRYNFNHEYGFGMVDAKAAVDLAPTWNRVPELREITSESAVINLAIPDLPSSGTPITVTTSLTIDPFVEFIEFVEVNAHFNHPFFRDLTVELVSPSGAVSTLSPSAPVRGSLTTEFRFGSARHLGEDPAGEWTLRITDHLHGGGGGVLKSWGITIYGHNGAIPGPPEIDTVTPGGGTLVVNWSAPTDIGETAITSYDLRYIREDATDKSDDNWSEVTGVGTLSNRSYTITGLSGGVMYEIQLRAHNDSGHGPWSQAEAEEPTVVAPAAPAITSISRGDRTLAVVWTAPADTTGGGVITAYDVRYIETSEDETVEANWTVRDNAWESGDLQYTVTGLTNATQYDVQVRAVNSAGDGAWSDTETGTPRPDDIPDNDTPGVTVSPTSLTIDEGSSGTYTVVLDTLPSGDVTVAIGSDNTDVTANPASLTFSTTDWATPQTVTVRAAEDADADDDTAAVTHTVSGYGTVSTAPEVSVNVTDNDTRGVTVTPTSLTVDEGGTDTYTVVLDTQPTGDVMVDIGSDNTDVTVSSSSLTFTTLNWSAEQTVTVTAGQDADAADDAATVTHDPRGADYNLVSNADLAVTVTDDETAGVTVTPTSLTIGEGGSGTYTVALDTQPSGDVTVTIVDPTDNTDVKAEPAALTFTTTNWNSAQTVTVSAVLDVDTDDDTATVTHTVSGYGSVSSAASVTVTVAEDPTAPYDTDGNSLIDKDEASVSVRGYLSDGTPPKAVASAVVRRYLSGE